MRLLRYWCRKGMAVLYLAAAAVLAGVFILFSEDGRPGFLWMLPVVYSLLLLFRTADDWFDYQKDSRNKPQPLTRTGLLVMFCILGGISVCLHVLAFGWTGLWGIGAVLAIPLAEKLPLLKTCWLAGAFVLYFCMSGTVIAYAQGAVCVVCLTVSVIYDLYKRKSS